MREIFNEGILSDGKEEHNTSRKGEPDSEKGTDAERRRIEKKKFLT